MAKLYHHLSETIKIKKISDDGESGVFYIEGLYTGFGLTLGNALRRALFSSLPGAAVTQIKIKGVKHEFTTLPNVSEDIVELTQNFKRIRFKFFADEPQVLTLKIKGEKEVKAGDIKTTSQVEIVNPNLHLATLTDKKAELEIEFTVEKSMGYSPVAERKFERLPIGTIVIDAIFSPVTKVNCLVENMRVGELTNFNRLKIEIETDGSLTPSQALKRTANVLKDHFDKIVLALASEDEEKNKKNK
jgi:DNA-directed RNA polymerase subunit alpha